MPLQISVSLSKKTSENYNSQGCSVSLSAELDQVLLTRPDELQQAIAELNEQAELAIDRKMNGGPSPTAPSSDRARFNDADHGRSNGSGSNGRSNARNQNGRGMTQAQRKAINAIARQLGLDAASEIRHELGVELDQASVSDASRFIDHLKSLQGSTTNRSRS
ncbi:MAG: hypothetical protein ACPGYV_00985 [Phycisphaeraceae bacterium]